MKKVTSLIFLLLSVLLMEAVCLLLFSCSDLWARAVLPMLIAIGAGCILLVGGGLYILLKKGRPAKVFSGFLLAICIASLAVFGVFGGLCLLADNYPYQGGFSMTTPLFEGKNVMVLIPHQDDEINIAGGLIEQYTESGSQVTVVFTTNGDRFGESELRAQEALSVLAPLGVEDVVYLGFGDLWLPQTYDGTAFSHIYSSPDPDTLWTSERGLTATYGTALIPCHQELDYTRSNYLHSIKAILLERRPDTIFVVDMDSHPDHIAVSLLFEEAMGQLLAEDPDYHPTVYKGFCYGTAWDAFSDFFSDVNLLSTRKPYDFIWNPAGSSYRWESRLRFPMSSTNLNRVLSNNSVYESLALHASQSAKLHAAKVLNGDKVFWERRTDSLLYGAEVAVDGQATPLLTDFKLRDYRDIADLTAPNTNCLNVQNRTVRIQLPAPVTANSLCLYQNPDALRDNWEGLVRFSNGQELSLGDGNATGNAVTLSFPDTELLWLEIALSGGENAVAELCEAELYQQARRPETDAFVMAVDGDGNFVYDYILQDTDTVALRLYTYPLEKALTAEDVTVSFSASGTESSCLWDGDLLVIFCAEKEECQITVSKGELQTTFTVSNPGAVRLLYEKLLRDTDRVLMNTEVLSYNMRVWFWCLITGQMF